MKIGIVDLRHVGLLVGACFAERYNFFFFLYTECKEIRNPDFNKRLILMNDNRFIDRNQFNRINVHS